jgi:hypothetical protein
LKRREGNRRKEKEKGKDQLERIREARPDVSRTRFTAS